MVYEDARLRRRPQEITLTLTAKQADQTENARKFTFADAFPVRWSGPQLLSANNIPRRGARRWRSPTPVSR